MLDTRVGYAGGTTPDPTYRRMGDHTETVQIDYDPAVIGYEDLLAEFWAAHRPIGPTPPKQYASIIFHDGEAERRAAEMSRKAAITRIGPVHTRIEPVGRFYRAEEYHQHYYKKRGLAGLCAITAAGVGR